MSKETVIDISCIKYGGQLIHEVKDAYGEIQVVDIQNTLRSLHFDHSTQQTTMAIAEPNQLIHQYTQAMLLPLVWQTPKRVLILGLGGGSLPKFCLHYLPHSVIDTVELRPAVTQIAHEFFQLPQPSDRFHIHHNKAETFLEQTHSSYDLILVDLFLTKQHKTTQIPLTQQLSTICTLLSDTGNLCINVMGHHFQYSGLEPLKKLFPDRLSVMATDQNNFILLAGQQPIPAQKTIDFNEKRQRYTLPFKSFYHKLTKQ